MASQHPTKWSWPQVFLIISIGVVTTDGLETVLSRCCNLGVRWSWDNKTCSEYPAPVTGVNAEHQAPCLSTVDACCRRHYREQQCLAGHETARSGRECVTGFGQGGHFQKDCCEGCKLGLIAGAMGLHCEFQSLKLALGPPWDTSLTKCCLQAGGRQGVIPPGSTAPPGNNNAGTSTVTGRSRPNPPSTSTRDICAEFSGQLCSHNCISEGTSYKCTCRDGYRLLPDGKSCQVEESGYRRQPSHTSSTEPLNNLSLGSPTGGERTTTQRYGACPIGFVFNGATQVCDDIDECQTSEGTRACFPYKTCRNTIGSFMCEQASSTSSTDEDGVAPGEQCPPGYRYNEVTRSCVDIDECAEGYDICVRDQYCINIPGGFDCQSKKEFNRYNCPAGYKFNNATLNCEDVDECAEKLDSCDASSEVCRNTAGAYECDVHCSQGYRYDTRHRSCQDVDECTEGTHDCVIGKESCVNVAGNYQCHPLQKGEDNCPPGYEQNPQYKLLCQDRDECTSGLHTCAPSETCVNEKGGYRCESAVVASDDDDDLSEDDLSDSDEDGDQSTDNPNSGTTTAGLASHRGGRQGLTSDFSVSRGTTHPRFLPQPTTTAPSRLLTTTTARSRQQCPSGFRQGPSSSRARPGPCEDIDECRENNPCDSSQACQNSVGSYFCHCRNGYYRDPITGACLDVNECQTGQHNCLPSQRCDNAPGTFTCIRITGCGTGYTLNSQSGQCEDDDECLFGNNECQHLGPEWQCKNTVGSFRCEKAQRQCPTSLSLAPSGECRPTCQPGYQFNPRGECIDIDECMVTPGVRPLCAPHQNCVNSEGSYQCLSKIICPSGFEPNPGGTRCSDIDECERGLHTCKASQICLNRGGGYVCQCPQGHTLTSSGECEDVDECSRYNVCASNAECHNTPGSFRCVCKHGFTQASDNRTCNDVDECSSVSGLCEQTCINTWGSYKCACSIGHMLRDDGRTCRDIDECENVKDGALCVGNCVNIPGSFRCECPEGYRLAPDGRTCQDIDECGRANACRSDEFCLNTRGGFRCNRMTCPPGYAKEGDQIDRCKKTVQCSDRDQSCLKQPFTISRNFLSFTSNVRIPSSGYVDMFNMRGPTWSGAVLHFDLSVKNTRAGVGIPVANMSHFLLRKPTPSQAVVALSKPISGPQDVELELRMEVYHRGNYAASALAQILIVVTTYEF